MFRKLIFCTLAVTGQVAGASTFEIAVTNTSRRDGFGGQNISGPALLIHDQSFRLFAAGRPASKALWEIAEEGDTTAALALMGRDRRVASSHKLTRIPRTQQGPSFNRFEVVRDVNSVRFSLAGMMTSTNDGFAGIDSQSLPRRRGEKVTYHLRAWDAGSEENNEMCPYVPCDDHYIRKVQGSEGHVAPHRGIQGIGILDRIDRGWPADQIVGFVEITRIN